MSETLNPTGTVSAELLSRFTAAEATGTFGDMDFDNMTEIANRTRFLDTDGTNDPSWTAPSLQNSWVNYGGGYADAGYYLDPVTNWVYLRGLIKSGTATAGTQLFTLPAGFRPATAEVFPAASNAAFGCVQVNASGVVSIEAGSNTYLSLCGIRFRVS